MKKGLKNRAIVMLISFVMIFTSTPIAIFAEEVPAGDQTQPAQELSEPVTNEPAAEPVADEPQNEPAAEPVAEEPQNEQPADGTAGGDGDVTPGEPQNGDAVNAPQDGEPQEGEPVQGEVTEPEGENPDEEKPEEEEVKYPAVKLNKLVNGVSVTLSAPEGSLPEGADMKVVPVSYGFVSDAVNEAMESEGKELVDLVAFDITPVDKDGREIQPKKPVVVTFSGTGLETGEGGDISVFCVSDDGSTATEMSTISANYNSQTFSASHFTIYAAGGSTTNQNADQSGTSTNDQEHTYVLPAGGNIELYTDKYGQGYSNVNWSITTGTNYAQLSGNSDRHRNVANINESETDQLVIVTHSYKRYNQNHSELFYITAEAPDRYEVSFKFKDYDDSDFTEVKTVTVIKGNDVPQGEIPSSYVSPKTIGDVTYYYTGWCTDTGCTSAAALTNITADTTVFSTYYRNVTLEYKKNSGSNPATVPDSQTVREGSEVTVSGGASYAGHSFVKWTTNPDGTGDEYYPDDPEKNKVTLNEDLVLYAQWSNEKIDLRYFNNFNEEDQSQFGDTEKVEQNQDIVLKTTYPDNEGYIFRGWSTNRTGDPEVMPGETYQTGSQAVNLYAIWGEQEDPDNLDIKSLTVRSLNEEGNTTVYDGTEYTISDVEEWDCDRSKTQIPNRKYTGYVKVKKGSGSHANIYADITDITASGTDAGTYTTPTAVLLYNHTDEGFDSLGKYIPVTNTDLVIEPVEVTISTGSDEKSYPGTATAGGSISFKNENGMQSVQLSPGDNVVRLVNGETMKINVKGTLDEVGSVENSYEIKWDESTASKQNYSITEGDIGTLTVYSMLTFNKNTTDTTVDGMPKKDIKVTGASVTLPGDVPTRYFHSFSGWTWTEGGTVKDYIAGEEITLTKEQLKTKTLTLYAVWEEDPVEIYFDPNAPEGTVDPTTIPATKTTDSGSCKLPDEVPKRGFYKFKGWARDGSEETFAPGADFTLTDEEIKAGKTTLHAVWEEDPVEIHFDPGAPAGTVKDMPADIDTMQSKVTLPGDAPKRDFYSFKGWARNGSEETFAPGAEFTLTDDEIKAGETTLHAVWEKNPVKITFDKNTTDAVYYMPDDTTSMTSVVTVPTNVPVRDFYKFKGWKRAGTTDTVAPGTEITLTEAEIEAGQVTFTAVWEKAPVKVSFSSGTKDDVTGMPGGFELMTSEFSLPAEEPARVDYKFIGWTTDPEGKLAPHKAGSKYILSPGEIAGTSVTFYAVWQRLEVKYGNIEGNGSSWKRGSGKALLFIFKRSVNDEVTFDRFIGILIDGRSVPRSKKIYTARKGSVIIELQPDYLKTLSPGRHTITALFSDGYSASAEFTIEGKKAGDKGGSGADTGDHSGIGGFLTLMMMSAFVLGVIYNRRKEAEEEEE